MLQNSFCEAGFVIYFYNVLLYMSNGKMTYFYFHYKVLGWKILCVCVFTNKIKSKTAFGSFVAQIIFVLLLLYLKYIVNI